MSLLTLIKLPVGSVLKGKPTITRLGTEIAEYVTKDGKTWKQVAYSTKNEGAKKLALQGYKQEVGNSQRVYGFKANDTFDEWGLPLKTSWKTTSKNARPLLFRLGLISENGGSQGKVVEYASRLADYWKM